MLTRSSVVRRALQAGILFGLVAFQAGTLAWPTAAGGQKAAKKADEPRIVVITVSLDKQVATPGELVRVTETVPADRELLVRGAGHWSYRIGDYDRAGDQIVSREIERFLHEDPNTLFDELPNATIGSGPMEFTVRNPREKGFEFELRPKKLGIYLIEARWLLKGGKYVFGQPVAIVVRPPRDEQGRPIVKKEWLP
jgi:hypothetical protein